MKLFLVELQYDGNDDKECNPLYHEDVPQKEPGRLLKPMHILDALFIEYATVYEPTYTDAETAFTSIDQQTFDPCIPTTLPVLVDELGNHVANCHSNGFDTQYQVIDKLMTMIT